MRKKNRIRFIALAMAIMMVLTSAITAVVNLF